MPGEKAGSASSSETLESYEAVILGAGVSGLVSASVLLAKGYRDILIADTYAHLGGNHIDWSSGDYTFDVGSFIFQDDSPLLRHFPELLTRYQIVSPTWGRLTPRGIVTSYPISVSDDILRPGWLEWMRISSSVIRARLFQRDISNAHEFARYWIGDHLLETSGPGIIHEAILWRGSGSNRRGAGRKEDAMDQ